MLIFYLLTSTAFMITVITMSGRLRSLRGSISILLGAQLQPCTDCATAVDSSSRALTVLFLCTATAVH